MSEENLVSMYIESVDQFIDAVPERFLSTLKQKILENKEDEVLNLTCQYVVKFFSYIPYDQCYHHGHFVSALMSRAMSIKEPMRTTGLKSKN